MAGEEAQVRLSIDVKSDPISGTIATNANHARRFSGWIELVALIEAVRADPQLDGVDETLGYLPGVTSAEV
jgi:hypothetical protein